MENIKYQQEDIDIFWEDFLTKTNRSRLIKYLDVFHFELTKELASELLQLVLSGE